MTSKKESVFANEELTKGMEIAWQISGNESSITNRKKIYFSWDIFF